MIDQSQPAALEQETETNDNSASTVRAYEDVIAKIRKLISDENMGPGDALPSERRLSDLFAVSRHSVREAIRVLQEQGVLAPKRGSGNYIRSSSREELTRALSSLVSGDARRLFEVFQLRELMEPQIAALAAEMILPEQLAEMDQLLRTQMTTEDLSELQKIDRNFHALIAKATGNALLSDLMDKISASMDPSRTEGHQSDERRVASITGHCRILKALQAHDPVAAAEAMRDHINDIKHAVSPDTP
ncbi:FadR/GntR family transcriptional regulator [Kiloniella majae]|uniref:FadR/GntR family transcriptional regulator n=1 Tax=Kiloniella majae TaxID=1938558 RepID=UPI000A278B36|nr:FadR/GntR family transcriptional regulator [Kiloniella majae]